MITLTGTIGNEVTAQAVREGLEATDASVDLYIDSPGGDVIEANAISLALSEYAIAHAEKTYTCTLGSLCASAAANILAKLPSCYTIKAYKGSLVMYHSCSGLVEGNPQQLRDFSVMMSLVNEAVIRELMNKTTLDGDTVKSAFLSGRELWLDGQTALACGLVDELIDAEPEQISYSNDARTKQVLALVATYKQHLEATKMDEKEEVKAEATPEIVASAEDEKVEVKAETEEVEVKEENEVVEANSGLDETEEIDWEAKCTEIKAENDKLKKEIDALKALVAKYTPTATPTAKQTVKADWLTMVRELNAQHLPEQAYAQAYSRLKAEHKDEFTAFMSQHTIR